MRKHNDYINIVMEYLHWYREYTTRIANIKANIDELEEQLQMEAAPKVPTLSQAPGSGGQSLSQQEREYFRKEDIPQEIEDLQKELSELAPHMNDLNRSLHGLPENDRTIVMRRMINNESWVLISSDLNVSETYCRRRLPEIVEKITFMMFGRKAMQDGRKYVFIKDNEANAM